MSDVYTKAVELHQKHKGKLAVTSVVEVKDKTDLSLVYTPGVAQVCREVAKDKNQSFELTWRGRCVAVLSDGSAVLGLGNIGAPAAMPVMEGKSLLMKQFGNVESVPICIDVHDAPGIIKFVKQIAPSFGAINLEDIAAPTCIEVEDNLQDIGIPVIHDDQHGTAIVVSAALINAAKVVGKKYEDLRVVISGAGSAGLAIAQMLLSMERVSGSLESQGGKRVKEVILLDSKGIISQKRIDLDHWKTEFANYTNEIDKEGDLSEAMKNIDAFIGVSKGGLVTAEMVGSMAKGAIVLAMANPDPEILPEEALKGGAMVVGTGRSDYANQINNSLCFPGMYAGLLKSHATKINHNIKIAARDALANSITPTVDKILPSMFDGTAKIIEEAVAQAVIKEGLCR